jgi:hypothetical protein
MGVTMEWKEENKSEHHLFVLYFVCSIYMAKVYFILYFTQYKTPPHNPREGILRSYKVV